MKSLEETIRVTLQNININNDFGKDTKSKDNKYKICFLNLHQGNANESSEISSPIKMILLSNIPKITNAAKM